MGNLKKLKYLTLEGNSALPEQFQKRILGDHTGAQMLLFDISIYYRKCDAARRAVLFITARYAEGDLAVFPRDMIRLIANEVWETRLDENWMDSSE